MRNNRLLTILKLAIAASFAIALTTTVEAQGARLALIVGNSTYAGDAALKNPVNDATDMAAALSKVGWKVSLVTDSDRRALNRAIFAFRDALAANEGADALFYYAGHGMQVDGVNYLIPVREVIDTIDDIKSDAVSIQLVTDSIGQGKAGVSLVILDACRDNPFAKKMSRSLGGTRGLSIVQTGGGSAGSAIMFSTSPGDVALDGNGRNGIFTAALLKYIDSDFKIEDLFKKVTGEVKSASGGSQNPWINASLSVDYYFISDALRATRIAAAAKVAEAAKQAELAKAAEEVRKQESAKTAAAQQEAEKAKAEAEAAKNLAAQSQALAKAAMEQAQAASLKISPNAPPGAIGASATATYPLSDSQAKADPAISLSLDGDDPILLPHTFANVAVGPHVVRMQNARWGSKSFVDTEETVVVEAGKRLEYHPSLVAKQGRLKISSIPAGAVVTLDGQTLSPLNDSGDGTQHFDGNTDAGFCTLKLETPAGQSWEKSQNIIANSSVSASIDSMVMTLPQRKIDIDGTTKSWEGLIPFPAAKNAFMDDPRYAITGFYLCRDDKYLYWRIDFASDNPEVNFPKGIKDNVIMQLVFEDGSKYSLNIGIQYFRSGDRGSYATIWDGNKGNGFMNPGLSYKNLPSRVVGRIAISTIKKYLVGAKEVYFDISNEPDNSSHRPTERHYISFK